MNQKHCQNMCHANVKVNLVVKNVNSNQKWNNGRCHCECKNPKACCVLKKFYLEF